MTLVSQPADSEEQGSTEPPSKPAGPRRDEPMWFLVWIINGLTLLVMGGLLLGQMERVVWLVDPLVQFRWQLTIALLVLAAIHMGWKRQSWMLVCLLIAFLPLARGAVLFLPSTDRFEVQPAEQKSTHRVMLLNLLKSNRNYKEVADFIREENPDVICLIEVTPKWARNLKHLDADYPYLATDPQFWSYDVRIYSKFPLAESREGDPVPTLDNAAIARAEVQFPERSVCIYATHPSSPTSPRRIRARNLQLQKMGNFVEKEALPLIVCGDFNSTTWSKRLRDFLTRCRLRDSRRGFGFQTTWPAMPGYWLMRITIDHYFVNDQIIVADRRVGRFLGSDHAPVILDFQIRSSEE